jgi:hypothetical protein
MSGKFSQLQLIAAAGERMIELSRWLDAQRNLSNVTRPTWVRGYPQVAVLQYFVEADVRVGWSICYCLEIRAYEESAIVEGSVSMQSPNGSDSQNDALRESSVTVTDEAGLSKALTVMFEDLWDSREVDLARVIALSNEAAR